jgi:hypothetical protein
LAERSAEFRVGVKHAAPDPFRGYANALRDDLSDAVQVLDAFHVVKLGTQVLDEVRRRVQQEQLARRGHKDDPLYEIRGLLRHVLEHLTDRQRARLQAGDPDWEVTTTWHCHQQLRGIYHAGSHTAGAALAEKIIASFPSCPISDVARLDRTYARGDPKSSPPSPPTASATAAPKPSTGLSRRPAESAMGTATSPTTGYDSSSPQATTATDDPDPRAHDDAEFRRALKPRADETDIGWYAVLSGAGQRKPVTWCLPSGYGDNDEDTIAAVVNNPT